MKTLTKIFCSLIVFLLFLMQAFLYAQDYVGGFAFDGYERQYEVYLPQDFQANMPLIVSMHGYSETIEEYKTYTVMHEVTDTMGFVLVYPQGINKDWNVGYIEPGYIPPDTDDAGFISALIDTMKSKYDIDLSRVYCCGFSAGGNMSFRMAGELGHRLAAIASVSGPLFGLADTWQPIQPMPVLYMHGTRDDLLSYTSGWGDYWSAQNTINYWLEKNDCTAQADTFSFPDNVPGDLCTIQKISYTSCSGESEVIHYKGINMGHSWPSSQTTFSTEGLKNRDVNANIEIMNFFNQFENSLVNMAYTKSMEVYPSYIQSQSDTLTVRADVSNPENHPAKVYAIIKDEQSTFIDSLQLFDDGLHSDGASSDNIWGNIKWLSVLPEDMYKVNLVTHDLTFGTAQNFHWPARFTTIGPVEVDNYTFIPDDTIPNPGDKLYFEITLRNNGLADTATNIKAKLISLDALVSASDSSLGFGDIAAGENAISSSTYTLSIDEEWPENTVISLAIEITSDDYLFWRDTLYIPDEPTNIEDNREPITRIYPNPTDNMLNIEISNTGKQGLAIEILDITGKVIYQREYVNISAHFSEQIDLSGYAKGIYLVKVRQADTVYVGKVVVR